jgi:hypothetical protein
MGTGGIPRADTGVTQGVDCTRGRTEHGRCGRRQHLQELTDVCLRPRVGGSAGVGDALLDEAVLRSTGELLVGGLAVAGLLGALARWR